MTTNILKSYKVKDLFVICKFIQSPICVSLLTDTRLGVVHFETNTYAKEWAL